MTDIHDFAGEFIGSFLLVYFGCSSVAVTVLFFSHVGLPGSIMAPLIAHLLRQKLMTLMADAAAEPVVSEQILRE